MRPLIPLESLSRWCRANLGAGADSVIFEAGYLSTVTGLKLADGREVVVKARPALERLGSCYRIQRHAWSNGFPCPEPLVPPSPAGNLVLSAEAYLPGGSGLAEEADRPRRFAEGLARLVGVCSTFAERFMLQPPPAWVWWGHRLPGLWPPPDDRVADLNEAPNGWLDDVGAHARARLLRDENPPVIGHSDWWQPNVAWQEGRLYAVYDWDSLAFLSEAAIVGAAASTFSVWDTGLSSVEEGEEFLLAYEKARRLPWTADEREVAWAAGLWLLAFNAKKESLASDGPNQEALRLDYRQRLQLSGA